MEIPLYDSCKGLVEAALEFKRTNPAAFFMGVERGACVGLTGWVLDDVTGKKLFYGDVRKADVTLVFNLDMRVEAQRVKLGYTLTRMKLG